MPEQETNIIYAITWVIAAFLLLTLLFFVMNQYRVVSIDPTLDTELSIYQMILMNSAKCFAYQDPLTGRMYNEIDLNKFNDAQLSRCVASDKVGLRLTLKDSEGKELKKLSRNINTEWKARNIKTSVLVRKSDGTKQIGELVTDVWFG
ncbi:hypothetical protein KY328_01130 [Candidatus Woesearchaeota archaeon]|nr:hypothetical protein [Candidatus Woesearchaeota archaeon]MBW3021500.1 hypothetical protein [Candidatus Woesearchaeota archaeon]